MHGGGMLDDDASTVRLCIGLGSFVAAPPRSGVAVTVDAGAMRDGELSVVCAFVSFGSGGASSHCGATNGATTIAAAAGGGLRLCAMSLSMSRFGKIVTWPS